MVRCGTNHATSVGVSSSTSVGGTVRSGAIRLESQGALQQVGSNHRIVAVQEVVVVHSSGTRLLLNLQNNVNAMKKDASEVKLPAGG